MNRAIKIFVAIIGVFVVSAAGYAAFIFIGQTPDDTENHLNSSMDKQDEEIDTSDWETYEDEELDISFKHPLQGLVTLDCPYNSPELETCVSLRVVGSNYEKDTLSGDSVGLLVRSASEALDPIKFDRAIVVSTSTIEVNGINWNYYYTEEGNSRKGIKAVAYDSQFTYEVSMGYFIDRQTEEEAIMLFESVLPTIKIENYKENKDSRELLSLLLNDNRYEGPYGQGCDAGFNTDEPSSTIKYLNSSKGISFEVPFNKNWGNEEYKINFYDEHEDSVIFGPILPFESCGWVRNYSLKAIPYKSADKTLNDLQEKYGATDSYEKTVINELSVVKLTSSGLCGGAFLQIIGDHYNYEIRSVCGNGVDAAVEKIVESVELFTPAGKVMAYDDKEVSSDSDWEIYYNESLGYQLLSPTDSSSIDVNFGIRLKGDASKTIDQHFYLDFPIDSKSTLGGQEAAVYKAPRGYGDGPGFSEPFITYSTIRNNKVYNLSFFGDDELSEDEEYVLNSFRFIGTPIIEDCVVYSSPYCEEGFVAVGGGRGEDGCELPPVCEERVVPTTVSNLCKNIGSVPFTLVDQDYHLEFNGAAGSVEWCNGVWKVNEGPVSEGGTFYFDSEGNFTDFCQYLFPDNNCDDKPALKCEQKNYCDPLILN